MSADNYWYVRLDGDKFVVTMEFASDEPRDLRPTDRRLDNVEQVTAYINEREAAGEWTEYGLAYGPGVAHRMVSRQLLDWLSDVKALFDAGQRPSRVPGPVGDHACKYETDEDGDDYVLVSYQLPDGIFAEIDGETYGTMYGFRIYLKQGGKVLAGRWDD